MEWLFLLAIGVVIYIAFNKGNKESVTSVKDENGLKNFRVTVSTEYYDQPKTKNKQPGKWVKPGEIVKVGNIEIKGGFIYFGGQLKSLDNYNTESSLIDPTLKVNVRSPDYGGDQMGYWPSYNDITPGSRAAYIEWLASKRNDPETNIGYIFLYFYGIERRLLVDDKRGQVSDDERIALVQELSRLKNIYSSNRSFNNYVTILLSHIWVINNQNKSELPNPELLVAKKNFTSVFKYLLANTVNQGNPITDELALAWVKSHPEFNLRTPARRCENEFSTLFKIRFKEKFDGGIKISPNKTKLQLSYYPASSSLRGYQGIRFDLPDVSRLKAPVKKLMAMAESCTCELDSFSRFVGRPEHLHNSLYALALLPNDLATLIANPQFERLKTWMKTQMSGYSGLVSVESLLEHFGEDAPLQINKKEAEMISNIIEKAGFGIAPDIRYHYAKPDINGNVVLFLGGHGKDFLSSHAFKQVGTILRLGAMVACIDNHIDESEVSLLENLINQDNQLTEIEKRSLNAYMLWRLNTPPNMAGLKARLETINNREKTTVSHILVAVALADGKIDPTEIKQLEKLYTSLGLDKSMVTGDIHNLSSNKKVGLLTENKIEKGNILDTEVNEITAFSLDRDLIKMHEKETQDVQDTLVRIFDEENVLDESGEEIISEVLPSRGITYSLDSKHNSLYEKLITKEEWSFDDVKQLCEEQQLMVDGAIEIINDWAFDNVDAPLIEDGETVFIDLELAEEIATL